MKALPIKFLLFLVLAITSLTISCKKDESGNNVQITGVWSYIRDTESAQITSVFFNNWIRIRGSGFTNLQSIYFNGQQVTFSPLYITDSDIIINVPLEIPTGDDVENPDMRNTIQLFTQNGQTLFEGFVFKDPDKVPTISGISYTLPHAGDIIEIYGSNLGETKTVTFPDSNQAEIKSVTDSILQVVIPANIDRQKSGSLTITVDNESYSSPPYMFYQNGIFLKTFTEDAMVPGGSNGIKIYSDANEIRALTGLANNPENIVAIPATKTNIPIAGGNGISSNFFKFFAHQAFSDIINKGGEITGDVSIENLAIQFDLYMPSSWISGAIPLKMNKNQGGANNAYIYNITPWGWQETSTGLQLTPFTFEHGWKTITLKLSDFPTLEMSNLSTYSNTLKSNGFESLVGYANYDMNEDGHTPQVVTGFQMYLANFRLVPLVNFN